MPRSATLLNHDARIYLAGAVLTVMVSALAVRLGATLGVEIVAVLLVYLGSVMAYLVAPHKAIAATIVLFALIPALKVFITPAVGGVKDVVAIGAITAAAILIVFQRQRMDRWVATLVAIFMGLYLINIGGPHGSDWEEGVRLTGEPILLLIVGFVAPNPRRNARWALGAFASVGVLVALYGILQQGLGISRLEGLGYVYGQQIRNDGGLLRSFGTMDDPFTYAAFLYFCIAAAFWSLRRGWLLWAIETVLLLGLLVSFVRTAGLVLLGFAGLWAVYRRLTFPASCLGVACVIIALLTLTHSSGLQIEPAEVFYSNGGSAQISAEVENHSAVLLNGRVSAWKAAVGSHPIDWIFGRGVGEVGTAAQRASVGVLQTASSAKNSSASATAVDSGYLATVADVGIVGLLVELALFGRLAALSIKHIRRGNIEGWAPLSFLTALLLDALTRASFTGFPTAFIGLMLIGTLIAALESEPDDLVARPTGPPHQRSSQWRDA